MKAYRDVLELNPSMVLALFNLAGWHASREEWDQCLALSEEAYAIAPLSRVAGLFAAALTRAGHTEQAADVLATMQQSDAIGHALGSAIYHWGMHELDAAADGFARAIDLRDPISAMLIRVWYGAELRTTPHWAELMKRLNLPS